MAERPVTKWRCLIEGCHLGGKWQPVLPGETYYPPDLPKSHYRQVHYPVFEAEYQQRLAEQREERMAHYRLTGEILRPRF